MTTKPQKIEGGKKQGWISEFTLLSSNPRRADYREWAKHRLELNLVEDSYLPGLFIYMAPLFGLVFGVIVYLIISNIL